MKGREVGALGHESPADDERIDRHQATISRRADTVAEGLIASQCHRPTTFREEVADRVMTTLLWKRRALEHTAREARLRTREETDPFEVADLAYTTLLREEVSGERTLSRIEDQGTFLITTAQQRVSRQLTPRRGVTLTAEDEVDAMTVDNRRRRTPRAACHHTFPQ